MKKIIRKTVCTLLVLTMLLVSLPVFTDSVKADASSLKCLSLEYTVDGIVSNVLTPNSTVEAKIGVSNHGGNSHALFVIAQYKDNRLVDAGVTSMPFNDGDEKTLYASTEIGNSTDGVRIKSFLWDQTNLTPISPVSVFPYVGDISLKNILIDGISIDGFSNDVTNYTYKVTDAYYPEVTAVPSDSSLKTSVLNDGLSSILTVTSPAGQTKTFKIDYLFYDEPEITNLTFKGAATTTGPQLITGGLQISANVFNDDTSGATFTKVVDELSNLDYYFKPSLSWKVDPLWYTTVGSAQEWFSFDINCAAEIYVVTEGNTPSFVNSDYTYVDQKSYQSRINTNWIYISDTTGFFTYNGTTNKGNRMYKSIMDVVPGQTAKVSVLVPNNGGNATPFFIGVKFYRNAAITNFKFTGPFRTSTTGTIDYPRYKRNLKLGDYIYTNKTWPFTQVSNEFAGLDYVQPPEPWNNSSTPIGLEWLDTVTASTWMTFNAKCPVEVSLIARTAYPKFASAENGWTRTQWPAGNSSALCYEQSGTKDMQYVSKKRFDATFDNQVTVELLNAGVTGYAYIPVFKPVLNDR